MIQWIRGMWAVAVLAALSGCSPIVSFSVGFGSGHGRLREGTVAGDENATAKVLMIDVRGLIADAEGSGLSALLLPSENPVAELDRRLRAAAKDPAVKALILRINSPGGTVTASHIMYQEVRRFAATGRPVVASLGEVATSGGYYLALAADRIVAEPSSITGSIGVIIPTMNVSEGLARIGIHSRNITSGPNKDLGDPFSPPREPHYAVLQSLVDDMYAGFTKLVVERRSGSEGEADGRTPLRTDLLTELTDGRVVTGARAVEVGLADRSGGIRDAFEEAKKLAGLSTARLVKYHTGSGRLTSPYATGAVPPMADGGGRGGGGGGPAPTEINLLQLQFAGGGLPGSAGANVYYLWMP